MRVSTPGWPGRIRRSHLLTAVFLGLCYLYAWLCINPALIYDGYWVTGRFPTFWLGSDFFAGFAARPGGLTEYASAFLSQLYYWPWAGALVVTAVGALLGLATWAYLAAVSGSPPRAIHMAPCVLLLILYSRYSNPLAEALALLVAVSCAAAYGWLPFRRWPFRLLAFLCLCAVASYLSAGAALMCAALCGIHELAAGRPLWGLAYAASAAGSLYVLAAHVLHVRVTAVYDRLVPPFHPEAIAESAILLHCLRLFFLFAAMGMLLERVRRRRAAEHGREPPEGPGARSVLPTAVPWAWRALEPLVLAAAAALPVFLCADRALRSVLAIEHYGQRKMWSQLLAEARALPFARCDGNVRWYLNLALYHTGGLPSRMFSFPQDPWALTPHGDPEADMEVQALNYAKFSRMLLELGRANEAEHMACEALELLGDRPAVVETLAMVSILKGEADAARVFLNALSRDLVRGGDACARLRALDEDPVAAHDAEVQRMRSLMVNTDLTTPFEFPDLLRQLLKWNGRNGMAFEYLMAHYLLQGDLKGVVDNMRRLGALGYGGVPRHYAEAAALYREAGGRVDGRGWEIGDEVEAACKEFRRELGAYGPDRCAARQGLKERWGESYFYYHEFALQGRRG